jgi:hypothetical protein
MTLPPATAGTENTLSNKSPATTITNAIIADERLAIKHLLSNLFGFTVRRRASVTAQFIQFYFGSNSSVKPESDTL